MLPWLAGLQIASNSLELLSKVKAGFLTRYETQSQNWEVSEMRLQSIGVRFISDLTMEISEIEPYRRFDVIDANLLSSTELASLIHFPGKDIGLGILETQTMKSKHPPLLYTEGPGVEVGTSQARGQIIPVVIPYTVRDRHVELVGKSGTGKSTLLFNSICQDIEAGFGVAVIDPHGDLVEDVLRSIPESRVEDTIYFNAGDKQFPVGLNILNAENEDEIGLLADDLLITFKRISESWGERMDTILRYAFHTMLRVPGATLLDISSLFQNARYRQRVLSGINNPLIVDFWQNQYSSYPKDAAQPILNRPRQVCPLSYPCRHPGAERFIT